MPNACLFCENPSGNREHLWPKWIHERRDFGPIHHAIGNRVRKVLPDPQLTVASVCGDCNNGWMSDLETENIPIIGSMFQDISIPLDEGQQRSVALWAVKTAMVMDSFKGRKPKALFYNRNECANLRIHRAIPGRTLVTMGRVSESLLVAKGVDFNRWAPGREWTVNGISGTIVVGHFVVQVVTLHSDPPDSDQDFTSIQPNAGNWPNLLTRLWPKGRDTIMWPPAVSFTNGGPLGVETLIARWRVGEKLDAIAR
jgi:hypothetical protein